MSGLEPNNQMGMDDLIFLGKACMLIGLLPY